MEITSYAPGTPNWVDLGTPDIDAARAFYGGLFGWTSEPGPPEAGGYTMCLLDGAPVAGLGPQMNPGPPTWTTYISVSDADATAAAVTAAGGTVVVDPMDVMDAGRMAVFIDPVGAACSIWQPRAHVGAGRVNEAGTLCWNELTVRDGDAAVAFYTTVFGWTARPSEPGSEMPYTEFQIDGRSIGGMMLMDEHWPAEVPSHWMVYFATDDVDASCARATELGGAVCVPPTDIQPGRFAVVDDPQGATFSLITMKAELLGS